MWSQPLLHIVRLHFHLPNIHRPQWRCSDNLRWSKGGLLWEFFCTPPTQQSSLTFFLFSYINLPSSTCKASCVAKGKEFCFLFIGVLVFIFVRLLCECNVVLSLVVWYTCVDLILNDKFDPNEDATLHV